VPPHQYVRARRMQRARDQLARGASVAAAAHAAGFASISQFRSAFRRSFGHAPRLTPQRGVREWIPKGVK
jgi:methylphosphotriester-DNA--protein-cysteine methyltransferase